MNLKLGDRVVFTTYYEEGACMYPRGFVSTVAMHNIGIPYIPCYNHPEFGIQLRSNLGEILKLVPKYKRNLPD